MTFSLKVKEEIISDNMLKTEKISLLSAYLRNNFEKEGEILLIRTEQEKIGLFLKSIIEEILSLEVSHQKQANKHCFSFNLTKKTSSSLGLFDNSGILLPNPEEFLISDEDQIRGYLKGVFLNSGSINDPKNSNTYHLEMNFLNHHEVVFIQSLLLRFNLNAKILKRKTKYILYIKNSEEISDFLKILKVSTNLLYFESVRVYNEEVNNINRINNVEQANTEKAMRSAFEQVRKINFLKEEGLLNILDEKVKITAKFRLKYPEASLLELASKLNKSGIEISKSGVYHHFRKIDELYKKGSINGK